ncbi:unnamed protein product [Euphydryas editha]|uniref:Uncharacterized protein n=1 Tax=Euphydryas editha TaxID=104508 RepID=A0AAU9TRQ4_EUPED|nr:unnamed protein product [Euphydryas editha]
METIRLFLLKIILSAIVLNIILAENTAAYSTIPEDYRKLTNKYKQRTVPTTTAFRRNWSQQLDITNIYKNVPPYLVFNQKVGAYYPFYKNPHENTRRTGIQKTRQ